jgi:flagellar basal body-associated protein FliL
MAGAKRGCLFVVTLVVVLAAVVAGAGAWFFYQQTRSPTPRSPRPPRAWSSPAAMA